jgi:hypothetical protein
MNPLDKQPERPRELSRRRPLDLSLTNADIKGSRTPDKYTRSSPYAAPDYRDIRGNSPKMKGYFSRHVESNPVEPKYDMDSKRPYDGRRPSRQVQETEPHEVHG